jgi:hypothetical protein
MIGSTGNQAGTGQYGRRLAPVGRMVKRPIYDEPGAKLALVYDKSADRPGQSRIEPRSAQRCTSASGRIGYFLR